MPEVSRIDRARFNMVQQQVRPWDVSDDRVLTALAEVPRESFVPDAYRSLAYADIEVPIAAGRVMLAPKIVGRLLQAVQPQPGDKALTIGADNGYLAACLAHLGARVLCLEDDPDLAREAENRLVGVAASGIEVRVEDGLAAPVVGGPFDVIAVTGSVPTDEPVAALQAQLAADGRLFVVVGQAPVMEALLVTRVGTRDFRRQALFETCAVPLAQVPEPDAFVF
ncbi:protein-L-isoaspartate carboxylmethyltransferase [Thioflavicoccus mobilis 8321]|uniref:Protein-L-isoaspartate O-methyltransferase n=1 Tax=Thioflavicoccus mobilis 8321 TaxID=765912 RepID=L0H0J0_9GAMM|nr:protein-L-isoaspartate O-methyltransferase [Thioflavicoccus mobilis]AGA91104.1 protein-L-isoaspartate carboxylmethyltransferase [Thioflavicoccus mobilis 8321]